MKNAWILSGKMMMKKFILKNKVWRFIMYLKAIKRHNIYTTRKSGDLYAERQRNEDYRKKT